MSEYLNEWWKMYAIDWMNVWMNEGMKNLGKIEASASSGLLHRLGVS